DGVTASYSRATGETVAGGPYHITATLSATVVGALDNYIITNNGASFAIEKRDATVTADNKGKTYGDDNPALTATVTGTVNGDTLNYSLATAAVKFSSVGDYPITVTLGVNPNYNVTKTDGTLTVIKAHLTVTVDDKSRAYGAANPTFTATISGFVNGESVAVVSGSPTFSGTGPSSTATTTVGNYVITPAVGTLSATNYDFTPFVNGTLTITKAHLTVTADDKSRAYGAANPTFTATISGCVNDETLEVVRDSQIVSGTGP